MDINKIKTEAIISEATGSWSHDCFTGVMCWNINTSGILSRLIKKAAECCDHYASDLFTSWNYIDSRLKDEEYTGGRYVFGFRDSGVDSNSFAEIRLGDPGMYGKTPYRAFWILDVIIKGDDIKMILSDTRAIGVDNVELPKERRQAIDIIDAFEDFLEERNVRIPTSDAAMREENAEKNNEARIYGMDYGELEDEIARILKGD